MAITHTFVSLKADGSDSSLVKPSDWNANHSVTPFTIAQILSDHNVTNHNSLGIDHTTLTNIGTNTHAQIDTHIAALISIHGFDANGAAPVTVRKNTGANIGTRHRLNLIEGSNITLTVADDSVNDEVDITITSTGGVGNHNFLSTEHQDTVAASPVLGDMIYANSTPAWQKLTGNTTTTKKFLNQTGNGAISAAPTWDVIAAGDLPTGIDSTKIADGTVTSTEFQYIGGLTSDAQTQINAKQATIVEQVDSFTISHATTDEAAGKAFTVTSFPTYGIIKKIKLRADFNAGQQTAGTALINNGSGILPADTSIVYDNDSPTDPFAANDFIFIDNEIMLVTGVDTGTNTLTVTRAQKGTRASFHDDNTTIVKANNGLRFVLYKDSNKKEVDKVLELNNLMTWTGTTDAAIIVDDFLIGFTGDILNVDKNDHLLIDDTADEEVIVQSVNHNVAGTTYDYTVFVRDPMLAHTITKTVYKLIVYDIPTPYKASTTTLYGTLFIDENIGSTVTATVEITTDKYA